MTEPDDDLDGLLSRRPAAGPSDGVRAELLRRTGRRLTWNRRFRQLGMAAGAAALFAGGMTTGWWAKPESVRMIEADPFPAVVVVVPVPVVVPAPEPAAEPSPEPLSPSQVEVRAELTDDPAEVARLYRLAGDKYLTDRQDYANATRCYRLFLARVGDPGLSPDPGDTWLLTSLKNAAFKEKYDGANRGG